MPIDMFMHSSFRKHLCTHDHMHAHTHVYTHIYALVCMDPPEQPAMHMYVYMHAQMSMM